MRLFPSARVYIPMVLVMGVVVMGVHISALWTTATSGTLLTTAAQAETKAEPKPAATETPAPVLEKPSDAPADIADDSPAQMELLKQLSDRRDQLEKRSGDLDQREALAKIAEQRIDQKNREMETLRQQLQSMVNQISESQSAQTENLVKIYETMKPKEAAKIFETLDMPVLLGVIQRMKPARTAPIMAEMAPEKAREITVALTKQDQLPKIK